MLIPALFALCFSIAAHAQTPRIDELKAQIAANPDSYELGAWQVEFAEQLLATLSVDGADTSVLYGIPSPPQLTRVLSYAADAIELTQRAKTSLERGAQALSEDPRFADERTFQDLRSSLAVEFLLIRLPLAQARAGALFWRASSFIEPIGANYAVIDQLREIESATPVIEAMRLSTLGSLERSDEIRGAINALVSETRLAEWRERSPHLARELNLARANQSSNLNDVAQILETQLLRFESERPLDGLAAREFRARRSLGSASKGSANGISRFLVFDAVRNNTSLAELVIGKCQQAITAEAVLEEIDPIDRIAKGRNARARRLSDESIRAFQSAWNGLNETDAAFRRLCGWDLARALRERGSPQDIADAGAVLLELAQFPNEPNAEQALASSIQLLQWSDRALAQQGADRSNVGAALRQALRLGLAKWPKTESADEWRLALANVVSGAEQRDLLESITARSGAFPRARLALAWLTYASLSKAPSDAQREAEAFTMLQFADQARAAAEQSAGDEFASLGASIDQARATALAELRRFEPAAEAAIAWDDAGGAGQPDAIDLVRRRAGEALRESLFIRDEERAAAIGALLDPLCIRLADRIKARKADRALIDAVAIDLNDAMVAMNQATELLAIAQDWSTSFGVTRGVGIALATGLRASGDNAAAFQTCRVVVDASRVLDVSDDLYWRAWAGMLEILEYQNVGGARSESITRQIARLRAEDNTLGGDLIKRRIEAVERKAKLARPAP